MVTNFRKLNAMAVPDSFPLSRIKEIIDEVRRTTFVFTFDFLKGYYSIKLMKRAHDLASFVTPIGLFSYKVMLFGLKMSQPHSNV